MFLKEVRMIWGICVYMYMYVICIIHTYMYIYIYLIYDTDYFVEIKGYNPYYIETYYITQYDFELSIIYSSFRLEKVMCCVVKLLRLPATGQNFILQSLCCNLNNRLKTSHSQIILASQILLWFCTVWFSVNSNTIKIAFLNCLSFDYSFTFS